MRDTDANYFLGIETSLCKHFRCNKHTQTRKTLQSIKKYILRLKHSMAILIWHWKMKENDCVLYHKECKCGNNTNYMKLLTMHNELQSSNLCVTLFNIRLLTYSSIITLTSLLFYGDIHSVTIIFSISDLSH